MKERNVLELLKDISIVFRNNVYELKKDGLIVGQGYSFSAALDDMILNMDSESKR